MNVEKELKSGKYQVAWFAQKIYSEMKPKSAIAKFNNKLKNTNGRTFTADELKAIEKLITTHEK